MSLFVDTSVWSLAFRRDTPSKAPETGELIRAIQAGEMLFTTGLVLQELLQGFSGPRARNALLEQLSAAAAAGSRLARPHRCGRTA